MHRDQAIQFIMYIGDEKIMKEAIALQIDKLFNIFSSPDIYRNRINFCQGVCDLMQGYVVRWSFLLGISTFS